MRCGSVWPIELTGRRVRVRSLTESDLALTLQWRNHPQSRIWFKSSAVIDEATHYVWFRSYELAGTELMFFVETHPERRPLGQAGIYTIDPVARRAEVGRFVSDPQWRGHGLFREALVLLLEHALGPMRLTEIHLEVVRENDRAIRLYRSLGFVEVDQAGPMLRMTLDTAAFAARNEASPRHGELSG